MYGDNNTGKSNILSFLEILFKQKYTEDITEASTETRNVRKPTGFWRGQIDDFLDNYYLNSNDPIEFSITVFFDRTEIQNIIGISPKFLDELDKRRDYDLLILEGQINSSEAGRAEITLMKSQFDQKNFYDASLPETERYLKDFEIDIAEAQNAFEGIMSTLDDCFLVIPATRFLTKEQEANRSDVISLNSDGFKNWLFQISVNRETEGVFRQITQQFGSDPFNYGRISIARVGQDGIEIFVQESEGSLKLPIERKGTGVQQILIILAYIANSRSPMIGIEELEINLSPTSQNSIFTDLHRLVNSQDIPVKQVFITTHSPYIGKRDEAERRAVWMESGETKVEKRPNLRIDEFFNSPIRRRKSK